MVLQNSGPCLISWCLVTWEQRNSLITDMPDLYTTVGMQSHLLKIRLDHLYLLINIVKRLIDYYHLIFSIQIFTFISIGCIRNTVSSNWRETLQKEIGLDYITWVINDHAWDGMGVEKILWKRSIFSAVFCVLRWVSFKVPLPFYAHSNNYQ